MTELVRQYLREAIKRDMIRFPEQAVKAGQINAMGLIDEILHYVIGLYRQQRNSQVMAEALDWLERNLGQEAVDNALQRFTEEFPALAVYQRELGDAEYLAGESGGVQNMQNDLQELL